MPLKSYTTLDYGSPMEQSAQNFLQKFMKGYVYNGTSSIKDLLRDDLTGKELKGIELGLPLHFELEEKLFEKSSILEILRMVRDPEVGEYRKQLAVVLFKKVTRHRNSKVFDRKDELDVIFLEDLLHTLFQTYGNTQDKVGHESDLINRKEIDDIGVHSDVKKKVLNYCVQGVNSEDTTSFAPLSAKQLEETTEFKLHATEADAFAQILDHLIQFCRKGLHVLQYFAQRPRKVLYLTENLEYMTMFELTLKTIFCNHTKEGIDCLFQSKLIDNVLYKAANMPLNGVPNRSLEEMENSIRIIQSIFRPPYVIRSGVFIYNTISIPHEKPDTRNKNQTFPSINGIRGRMGFSLDVRKFTSRKIQYVVQLILKDNRVLQSIIRTCVQEVQAYSKFTIMDIGLPFINCFSIIEQLLTVGESDDFNEKQTGKGTSDLSVNCWIFKCRTHLIQLGEVFVKNPKKIKGLGSSSESDFVKCFMELNCILGIRIQWVQSTPTERTSLAPFDANAPPSPRDNTPQWNDENAIIIPLETIDSLKLEENKSSPSERKESKYVMKILLTNGSEIEIAMPNPRGDIQVCKELRAKWFRNISDCVDGEPSALEVFCRANWEESLDEIASIRSLLETEMGKEVRLIIELLRNEVDHNSTGCGSLRAHRMTVVEVLFSVTKFASETLDCIMADEGVLSILFGLFKSFPSSSMLHNLIAKFIRFLILDPTGKRSESCPLVHQLMDPNTETPSLFSSLSELHHHHVHSEKKTQLDYRVHLKSILYALSECIRMPMSASHEFIKQTLTTKKDWKHIWECIDESILSKTSRDEPEGIKNGRRPPSPTSLLSTEDYRPPLEPDFQKELVSELMKQNLTDSEGQSVNMSILRGNGCLFGFMHKQTLASSLTSPTCKLIWKQVLVVLEKPTCKLWFFYTFDQENLVTQYARNQSNSASRIRWKWFIPSAATSKFCTGDDFDLKNVTVGHYGLDIKSDKDHKNYFFALPSRAAREQWKIALRETISKSEALSSEFKKFTQTKKKNQARPLLKKKAHEQPKDIPRQTPAHGGSNETAVLVALDMPVGSLSLQRSTSAPAKSEELSGPKLNTGEGLGLLDRNNCPVCGVRFTLYRRRHECKRCGRDLCGKCSDFRQSIPECGLYKPVRHCLSCYEASGGKLAELEPIHIRRGPPVIHGLKGSVSQTNLASLN